MDRLRALSAAAGAVLVALSLWATAEYGTPARFVPVALAGAVAVALPDAAVRLRGVARTVSRRVSGPNPAVGERGWTFVSDSTVKDRLDLLEGLIPVIETDDRYDAVERDTYEEGAALNVSCAGIHGAFVRVTAAGRVVVLGSSERARHLAETVESATSLTLERVADNPFDEPAPVGRFASLALGGAVAVLLVVGVLLLGVGAYPSDAYNPAERTVLVGIDFQTDLDPTVSGTDGRLSKAAFLASVVDEGATEVRWARNDTDRIAAQGRDALRVSRTARALLDSVERPAATDARVERVRRLEQRLARAERSVAAALEDRAADDGLSDTDRLRRLADRLRAANGTSPPC